ncbi:MAG: LacI family DNA-binding transcriptional regulator [bacterium]
MKKSHNPTLEDVAKEAGVSTATISRCINEPNKVARPTRDRIEEVIQRLGYTPNFGGKVLASKRSNTVGAIIPTMSNSMFAIGLQAFQEVLSQAGIRLLVASAGYDSENELSQIRSLVTHGADALLLIGSTRPKETVEFLSVRKIPYVISWCFNDDTDQIYSGFNNQKAAKNITTKVLDFGHRQIAMIAGQTKGNDRAGNRIAGVNAAIEAYGKDAALTHIVETQYSLEDGGTAFEQIMSASSPPTAIICGNDVLAAGAIVRARRLSIDVPEQVSITGFDDISLASAVFPALTTVRVPQIQMGKTAAELVLKLLANDPTVSSIEFETEIVLRDSLAPVNP